MFDGDREIRGKKASKVKTLDASQTAEVFSLSGSTDVQLKSAQSDPSVQKQRKE